MQVSRLIIPSLLSCVIGVVACDDASDGGVVAGLAPGETDEGGAELGIGDGDGDGDVSDTFRIVLGGDGSPFVDNTLNAFSGGSYDGLLVSFYIDPATSSYEWKRYHGGNTNERVMDLDIDQNGRICGSGWTNSTNLPATANAAQPTRGGGTRDLFVGCWDQNGSMLYSSYLGGSLAELNDNAVTIWPTNGNPIVTGATNSLNLKTSATGFQPASAGGNDALAFKYSATGSLSWGTYVGGTGSDTVGIDSGVDPDGATWMIGNTASANFPVTDGSTLQGAQDIGVARLSKDGASLELGTFLGGSAMDYGVRIDVLPDGTAIACGNTYSEDFPVSNDAVQTSHGSQLGAANYDVALAHLDTDGTVLAATYLGGAGFDACLFLDVDDAGDVYVAGWSDDLDDFPLTSNVSVWGPRKPNVQEGFLVKLDPEFEAIEFAVRTQVTRAMDVIGDGRAVLLGPEDDGVPTTPNAIPGESGNLLVVYAHDGLSAEYSGYLMGEGMFVEVLQVVELP